MMLHFPSAAPSQLASINMSPTHTGNARIYEPICRIDKHLNATAENHCKEQSFTVPLL